MVENTSMWNQTYLIHSCQVCLMALVSKWNAFLLQILKLVPIDIYVV